MAALTSVAEDADREELRGTARGGLVNLVGAAVSGVGGLAVTWLAAVALSPAEAGAFFAATSVFLLAGAIARLGTPTGLVYWVARLNKNGRDGAVGSVLKLGLWPAAIASMAAALGLLLAAPMFARPDLVRLIAVFLPASVAMEALLAATRGYRLMGPSVVIDKLGRTAAQLVGLAAIALAGTASAFYITFAWVLPYLPAALAAGWYLLRRHRRSRSDPGFPDRVSARAFWGFTAPRAAAGVAQLGLQRLDIIMVAALAGLGPAAVYTVATRFVIVGQMASHAVGQSVQPRAAAAMAAGEPASARALYQESTAWIVALDVAGVPDGGPAGGLVSAVVRRRVRERRRAAGGVDPGARDDVRLGVRGGRHDARDGGEDLVAVDRRGDRARRQRRLEPGADSLDGGGRRGDRVVGGRSGQ